MPRSRNSRSISPQKAPSSNETQGNPSFQVNRDGILENVQEIFSGQLDQQVIHLVLSECSWNVDEAIDKLLTIAESGKVAVKKPQSQLAQIAEGIFGSYSDIPRKEEKPNFPASPLPFSERTIQHPDKSRCSPQAPVVTATSSDWSEFKQINISCSGGSAHTDLNVPYYSSPTSNLYPSSELHPGNPYTCPVIEREGQGSTTQSDKVLPPEAEPGGNIGQKWEEYLKIKEGPSTESASKEKVQSTEMGSTKDFKPLFSGLGNMSSPHIAMSGHLSMDKLKGEAGRKFPVRLLSREPDEYSDSDSFKQHQKPTIAFGSEGTVNAWRAERSHTQRLDSADLDETVLKCIYQVSPDVVDDSEEIDQLRPDRGQSLSSATETESSTSSQAASPEPGRFQTSTPSNQPMTLPVLGTGLSVEAPEFVPRKKSKSHKKADGKAKRETDEVQVSPQDDHVDTDVSPVPTGPSTTPVLVPVPSSSPYLNNPGSLTGSPMFITPHVIHRLPPPPRILPQPGLARPPSYYSQTLARPTYPIPRQAGAMSYAGRVVFPVAEQPHLIRMSPPTRVTPTIHSGPQSPNTIDDMAVIATGQPIMATSEAQRHAYQVSPPISGVQTMGLAKSLLFQNSIEKKVKLVQDLIQTGEKVLVIVRGLPGSGKSTLSRALRLNGVVLSTDDFFMKDGIYEHRPKLLTQAHEWNKDRAKEALKLGTNPIIIDNTNTQKWEFKLYAVMAQSSGYVVQIFEPDTPWKFIAKELARRTVHGVPKEHIQRMLERYERDVTVDMIISKPKKTFTQGESDAPESDESTNNSCEQQTSITNLSAKKRKFIEVSDEQVSMVEIDGDASSDMGPYITDVDHLQDWDMYQEEFMTWDRKGTRQKKSTNPDNLDQKPEPVGSETNSVGSSDVFGVETVTYRTKEMYYSGSDTEEEDTDETKSTQDETSFHSCASDIQGSNSVSPNIAAREPRDDSSSGSAGPEIMITRQCATNIAVPEEVMQMVDDLISEHVTGDTTLSTDNFSRIEEELKAYLLIFGLPEEQRIAAENLIGQKLRKGKVVQYEKRDSSNNSNSDIEEISKEKIQRIVNDRPESLEYSCPYINVEDTKAVTDTVPVPVNIAVLSQSSSSASEILSSEGQSRKNSDTVKYEDSSVNDVETDVLRNVDNEEPVQQDGIISTPSEETNSNSSKDAASEENVEMFIAGPTEEELRYWGQGSCEVQPFTDLVQKVQMTWDNENDPAEPWDSSTSVTDRSNDSDVKPQRNRKKNRVAAKLKNDADLAFENTDLCTVTYTDPGMYPVIACDNDTSVDDVDRKLNIHESEGNVSHSVKSDEIVDQYGEHKNLCDFENEGLGKDSDKQERKEECKEKIIENERLRTGGEEAPAEVSEQTIELLERNRGHIGTDLMCFATGSENSSFQSSASVDQEIKTSSETVLTENQVESGTGSIENGDISLTTVAEGSVTKKGSGKESSSVCSVAVLDQLVHDSNSKISASAESRVPVTVGDFVFEEDSVLIALSNRDEEITDAIGNVQQSSVDPGGVGTESLTECNRIIPELPQQPLEEEVTFDFTDVKSVAALPNTYSIKSSTATGTDLNTPADILISTEQPRLDTHNKLNGSTSEQDYSSIETSPKPASKSKRKKQSKKRMTAKLKEPFFDSSDKEKFFTGDWSSLPLSSNAAFQKQTENDVNETESVVCLTFKDKETLTDDWKLVTLVTEQGFSGPLDGFIVVTGRNRKITFDVDREGVDWPEDENISRVRMMDRSTSVDQELLTSMQERGIDTLTRCFPDVSEEELECVLHTTQHNVEWAINLLLDWKYSLKLNKEEKDSFVNALSKVKGQQSSSVSKVLGSQDVRSPQCLLDLCFSYIEKENIAPREEIEQQLIQTGMERLERLEQDNREKIRLQRSTSLIETYRDSYCDETLSSKSLVQRSFSVPSSSFKHKTELESCFDQDSVLETHTNIRDSSEVDSRTHFIGPVEKHGDAEIKGVDFREAAWSSKQDITSARKPQCREEKSNCEDLKIAYKDSNDVPYRTNGPDIPDQGSDDLTRTMNGQTGCQLVDYELSPGEEQVEQSHSRTSIDSSPGLLLASPVLSLTVTKDVLQTLQQLFGPVAEDDPGVECTSLLVDRDTAWLLHKCWRRTVKHREKLLEQQYLEDEALARKLQEEQDMHDLRLEEREERNKESRHGNGSGSWHMHTTPYSGMSAQGTRAGSYKPVRSFQEIMDEEMANQFEKENKMKILEAEGKSTALSTRMKRQQLYESFPTIDKTVLDDLFAANSYNLTDTLDAIRLSLESDTSPPHNIMTKEAADTYDEHMMEAAKKQSLQEMLDSFMYTPVVKKDYQDSGEPEYEDYRGEANLHYRLRHECFQKAQEAYRRGLKQVASFYSQQGHLHTQKIKEANMRASEQILSERNNELEKNLTLDLHGLHINEAIAALDKILPQKMADRKAAHLIVITGRGSHSRGGVAKLRPSVQAYLSRNKYHFTEQQQGVFRVSLKNKTDR